MDLIAFKGALDGVIHLKNVLETLAAEKRDMAVREGILDVVRKLTPVYESLFQARQDAAALQDERDKLRRRVQELEDWKEIESNYRLVVMPGATVRESVSEPRHYACPACFAQKKLLPLTESERGLFVCPAATCRAAFDTTLGGEIKVLTGSSFLDR